MNPYFILFVIHEDEHFYKREKCMSNEIELSFCVGWQESITAMKYFDNNSE